MTKFDKPSADHLSRNIDGSPAAKKTPITKTKRGAPGPRQAPPELKASPIAARQAISERQSMPEFHQNHARLRAERVLREKAAAPTEVEKTKR